jgi:hypothetical protein
MLWLVGLRFASDIVRTRKLNTWARAGAPQQIFSRFSDLSRIVRFDRPPPLRYTQATFWKQRSAIKDVLEQRLHRAGLG